MSTVCSLAGNFVLFIGNAMRFVIKYRIDFVMTCKYHNEPTDCIRVCCYFGWNFSYLISTKKIFSMRRLFWLQLIFMCPFGKERKEKNKYFPLKKKKENENFWEQNRWRFFLWKMPNVTMRTSCKIQTHSV